MEHIQRGATDSFVHERLYGELCGHIQTLSGFLSISSFVEDSGNRETVNTLESLQECLNFLMTAHERRQRTRSDNRYALLPPLVLTGHRGRPQYSISEDQTSHLVSFGMNW